MRANPEEASLPIRVDAKGDLPIYLQIKYQISYLISTEKLPPGARLPAVRVLASQLGLNHHTVAQAYRELQSDGLIDSSVGRGSFVRQFSDLDRVRAVRHERLTNVLGEARLKARALGFSDAEIVQRLASIAHQQALPCPIVYVDRVPHTAEKYARRLEHHLSGAVSASPVALGDVVEGNERAHAALEHAFYVVTVARNVPVLEQHLPRYGPAHEVLTIVAELLPSTIEALSSIPPDTRAIVLTEEPYVYSSLNLVALYSPLDPTTVELFTVAAKERFVEAAKSAELILYTFGVASALEAMEPELRDSRARRLELAFDIGQDSIAKLRNVFGVNGSDVFD